MSDRRPTAAQIELAEAALRQIDEDEGDWPTGEQVEAIIIAACPEIPVINGVVRGYMAQAAAQARADGVDAESQESLDAIARLGISGGN